MSAPSFDTSRRLVNLGILVFTLLGLGARAVLSWYKPFLGDEVGTWIYIAKDIRFLLTHFIDPWLSMPAFIAGVRVWSQLFGEEAFVLRLPVVLAGTLAIPYLAAIVRRLGGSGLAVVAAAALMALNPSALEQGANLRSYAFVLLFITMSIHYILAWLEQPGWRNGGCFALSAGLALLSHFCTLYYLMGLGVFFLWAVLQKYPLTPLLAWVSRLRSLWLPLAVVAPLMVLHYLGFMDGMIAYRKVWTDQPPGPVNYLPHLVATFLAPGWHAIPLLALLFAGWLSAVRQHTTRAVLIGLGMAFPMLLHAASGAQAYPWATTRLHVPMLPLLLIQLALALDGPIRRRWLAVSALVGVLLIWMPYLRGELRHHQAEPWPAVQSFLAEAIAPQDHIWAAGHDRLHLQPGFPRDFDRLVSGATYARVCAEAPASRQKLYVVTVGYKLAQADEVTVLGNIRVNAFHARPPEAQARRVIHSLQYIWDGRADPQHTAWMRECADLMTILPWDMEERRATERLYYHSFLRSERGQFMHPRLREISFP